MAYTDIYFYVFFAVTAVLYFILPKKAGRPLLLLASYIYIFLWDIKSGFFALGVTALTYLGGLLIDNDDQNTSGKKHRKAFFVITLTVIFGLLAVMKYTEFAVDSSVRLINSFGGNISFDFPDIVMPVGLSFYTFASAGYLIDVYKNKRRAEKNLINYALFTSFFPNFSSGPIERSDNLLRQINNIESVKIRSYDRIASGVLLMLWGAFQKLVIADRAAILVNKVFGECQSYGSTGLILGAVMFSIQIYGDFAGGSYMAIGCAKILGYDLIDNFDAPYFALSIKEFWRRWHISLSTWFRDYLYIPLGGNRRGEARKYFNMFVVFIVCGVWHGADWTFLVWGFIHAVYQIVGGLTKNGRNRLYEKMKIDTSSHAFRALSRLCTFSLTTFAWIFFRAGSLKQALVYIAGIFTRPDIWNVMNGHIYELGLDVTELNILFCAVAVLFIVDYFRYKKKKNFPQLVGGQQYLVRLAVAAALVAAVLVFGCYGSSFGAGDFIYADF